MPVNHGAVLSINVNGNGIAGLESKTQKILDHLIVAVDVPICRPEWVANRVNAICVMTAQIESEFVFCNQCVCFRQENINFVNIVVQGF